MGFQDFVPFFPGHIIPNTFLFLTRPHGVIKLFLSLKTFLICVVFTLPGLFSLGFLELSAAAVVPASPMVLCNLDNWKAISCTSSYQRELKGRYSEW